MEGGARLQIARACVDCLAKDARASEDRRTALTVGSLRERCSVRSGKKPSNVQNASMMQMDLEQKDSGGSEDTTRESPAQDPSLSTF